MKWNNSLTTDMHLPRTPLRRPFLSIASRGYSRIANVSIPISVDLQIPKSEFPKNVFNYSKHVSNNFLTSNSKHYEYR